MAAKCKKRVETERTPTGRYRFIIWQGETLVYRSVRAYPTRDRAKQKGLDWRRGVPTEVGGVCDDCGKAQAAPGEVLCVPCFES